MSSWLSEFPWSVLISLEIVMLLAGCVATSVVCFHSCFPVIYDLSCYDEWFLVMLMRFNVIPVLWISLECSYEFVNFNVDECGSPAVCLQAPRCQATSSCASSKI